MADLSDISAEAVTELKPGDRVQLDDQGRESDYGTVITPPKMMLPDDPGPRVRVDYPFTQIRTATPLVSDVRRIPPDEEQEIWLRPWVVSGEQICDDPEEYNHPYMLFVHEGSLPEIIRTYLAANGLTPPGTSAALPVLNTAKDSELAELRAENEALKAKLNEAYQHIGEQALIDMEEPIPPYGSAERDAAVKALRGER